MRYLSSIHLHCYLGERYICALVLYVRNCASSSTCYIVSKLESITCVFVIRSTAAREERRCILTPAKTLSLLL